MDKGILEIKNEKGEVMGVCTTTREKYDSYVTDLMADSTTVLSITEDGETGVSVTDISSGRRPHTLLFRPAPLAREAETELSKTYIKILLCRSDRSY